MDLIEQLEQTLNNKHNLSLLDKIKRMKDDWSVVHISTDEVDHLLQIVEGKEEKGIDGKMSILVSKLIVDNYDQFSDKEKEEIDSTFTWNTVYKLLDILKNTTKKQKRTLDFKKSKLDELDKYIDKIKDVGFFSTDFKKYYEDDKVKYKFGKKQSSILRYLNENGKSHKRDIEECCNLRRSIYETFYRSNIVAYKELIEKDGQGYYWLKK